jgi:ribosomal protein S18 acetylase RimI-like enzyme
MSQLAKGKLRILTAKDVSSALELSGQAGWNQTADDWRMLIALAPQSCLGVEVDGELAATTTLLGYGSQLAWIGMVLTKIKFRGQGLARRLLTEALEMADRMKIESVKLDATDQGKPLYEKSGFRSEQSVQRWSRDGIGSVISPSTESNSLPERWHDADYEAFGADRSALIAKLSQRKSAWCHSKSFLLARSGSKTAYVGPCVSDDAQVASSLIESCIQSTKAALSWDLLSQNQDAVTIAKEFGFTPRRYLTRMVRGKDLRGREKSIYALAGFEFG